jgi:hypothetical protein
VTRLRLIKLLVFVNRRLPHAENRPAADWAFAARGRHPPPRPYRDRIVHISLSGEEGGMNLNMPQEVLNRIAAKGTQAGDLLKRFSFENHYWIRWRILASAVQRYTIAVAASDESHPRIAAYADAYQLPKGGEPPSYRFPSADRREEAQRLYARLVTKGKEWEDLGPDLSEDSPRPLPQMQIRPIF